MSACRSGCEDLQTWKEEQTQEESSLEDQGPGDDWLLRGQSFDDEEPMGSLDEHMMLHVPGQMPVRSGL